jgi:hypothetical protein
MAFRASATDATVPRGGIGRVDDAVRSSRWAGGVVAHARLAEEIETLCDDSQRISEILYPMWVAVDRLIVN